MTRKRIFWLGMHKILIPTELKALRDLGYEVFNPPYLSEIRDQSAVLDWQPGDSSLPKEVFSKLSSYNFFYSQISAEISELLNEYFDAIVVTINPDWLLSVLHAFRKTIIYRTYGQLGTVSEALLHNGSFDLIIERDNFWFVPHSDETANDEHAWLRRRMHVAPYWLTDDVLDLKDHWKHVQDKNPHIGLCCPNITNRYYNNHFLYLKAHFEQRWFRYFGVQIEENSDPNVVGTLSRADQLQAFLKLSGFLYTYPERNTCYLPPIEMMVLGAPVIYLPGSLLHRYFGAESPGFVPDENAAIIAARRLVARDRYFIDDIVESQIPIVERYTKTHCLPIFSRIIKEILGSPSGSPFLYSPRKDLSGKPVLVLGHFEEGYGYSNGEYTSVHGIPRVMRQIVKSLTESDVPVVVTALHSDVVNTYGFYASQTLKSEHLSIFPAEDFRGSGRMPPVSQATDHWIDSVLPVPILLLRGLLVLLKQLLRRYQGKFKNNDPDASSRNSDDDPWQCVIVPHYYLFPEALNLSTKHLVTYLPDYMPHFFAGRGYFPEEESHLRIGRGLVKKSKTVLTSSSFSARYLPISKLAVPAEKIVIFPLPLLSPSPKDQGANDVEERVRSALENEIFIFYPTQPHPNKRIDLLLKSWIKVRALRSRIKVKLVLTAGKLDPTLMELIEEAELASDIYLLPRITDTSLSWLYESASCLAFPSELEGNFPTQVLEALLHNCPVVTMNNPLIADELGPLMRHFLVAEFADTDAFAELIVYAIEHRDQTLENQRNLLEFVKTKFAFEKYRDNILTLIGADVPIKTNDAVGGEGSGYEGRSLTPSKPHSALNATG
ncbi:MAG: wbkB [Nevskia sp.]|nr:wbkB [Nevskia sp.]